MARVYPLFSSSDGNATFIGNRHEGILIDAGVSCKRLIEALEANTIPVSAIRGIFITHEHIDHIRGLKTLTSKYALSVFASPLTAQYLSENDHISPRSKLYDISGDIQAGDFSITAFETPHDSAQSCGYRIHTPDGKTVCVCTDLGEVTNTVHEHLIGADIVLLEANYDYQMLKNGAYPYQVKQRILSQHGHLENSDCGRELKRLAESGTTRMIIGHLSPRNNRPDIAERAVMSQMSGLTRNMDYILLTAPVQTQGEVMIV